MSAWGRATDWVALLGGILLGWFGTWALFVLMVLVVYGVYGGTGGTTSQVVVAVVALLALTMVSAGALVTQGRTRLRHEVLMGLAVGSIVGSGVCAASVLP